MLDNQQRDPEVNLKSILGSNEKVMNLRPLDKSKHVGNKAYFSHKAHTDAQRMQDEALLYRKHHLYDGDISLPPVNREVGRMNKMIRKNQTSDYEAETTTQDAISKNKNKKVTNIFELES